MTIEFFWQVLECIPKFIIELHGQLFLFVRGSSKQQKRGGIISYFTKENTFFISYISSSCTLQKKVFFFPLVRPRREYTWTLIWMRSLLICLKNCQGVPCFHRQSRKRMMSTFIMLRDSLEHRSMLAPYKKGLPSLFSFPKKKKIYLSTHLRATMVFPIPTGKVGRRWLTLC